MFKYKYLSILNAVMLNIFRYLFSLSTEYLLKNFQDNIAVIIFNYISKKISGKYVLTEKDSISI
jgi:hypothetical protein